MITGIRRPIFTIFISSTVYDLEAERKLVEETLQKTRGPVRFNCLSSDSDSFPITPQDLAKLHSYDICLDKVAQADFFVLLVKERYGRPNVRDNENNELISITHREYREAFRRRIPIFHFVHQATWDARLLYNKQQAQSVVSTGQVGVFQLLNEITNQPRNNWIFHYSGLPELRAKLRSKLLNYDHSEFIADITIPDGSIIPVNRKFEKTWEIKNAGCQVWRGRFLQCVNAEASGLLPDQVRVAIPETAPGQKVQISVQLTGYKYPGTCESIWKMVDEQGKPCFPNYKGLYCKVQVRY